jgi:hypothetical protein
MIKNTHASQITRISSDTNNLIASVMPVALSVVIGGYRSSVLEIHHGLLAACAGKLVPQLGLLVSVG